MKPHNGLKCNRVWCDVVQVTGLGTQSVEAVCVKTVHAFINSLGAQGAGTQHHIIRVLTVSGLQLEHSTCLPGVDLQQWLGGVLCTG
jgi:hypothetical protein